MLPKSRALGTGREVEAGRQPPRGSLLRRAAGTKPKLRYFSPADASRAGGEKTPKGAEPRPPGTQDAGAEAVEAAGRPAPGTLPGSRKGCAPGPAPAEGRGGPAGGGEAHQAELANFVVGHKAEYVLDGYDGQRHQCVVLRQVVRSQRGRRRCLGARLRGLRRGRRGLSLSGAGGRTGAAVAVAAASFFSHPLLRRRRHLGSLSPSSTVKGPGHFLCVTSSFCLLGAGVGGQKEREELVG